MQETIHQPHREFVDDRPVLFGEIREPGKGLLQLTPSHGLGGLSESCDIDERLRAQRFDEAFRLLSNPMVDSREGRGRRGTLTPGREAVKIQQVYSGKTATARIYVPRKAEIDEPHRPALASTNRGADHLLRDERAPDRGRGKDNVGVGEKGLQVGPWDGFPLKTLRELAGPWKIPIHNADFGVRPKLLCGDPGHLPRPDDRDDSTLNGYDGLEESNGRVARRRVSRGDASNRSNGGGDSGGLEKHGGKVALGGPSRSPRRGAPDLSRHLLLAFRQGVQAAGDPNEMSRCIAVFEDVQHPLVEGDAEGLSNEFGGPSRVFRECIHFDSIARGQEDDIGPRWSRSARLPQGSVRGLPEKPLTRLEARSPMVGPDDDEVSRSSACREVRATGRKGRLAIHRLANRATQQAYKNVRANDSHHKANFGGDQTDPDDVRREARPRRDRLPHSVVLRTCGGRRPSAGRTQRSPRRTCSSAGSGRTGSPAPRTPRPPRRTQGTRSLSSSDASSLPRFRTSRYPLRVPIRMGSGEWSNGPTLSAYEHGHSTSPTWASPPRLSKTHIECIGYNAL